MVTLYSNNIAFLAKFWIGIIVSQTKITSQSVVTKSDIYFTYYLGSKPNECSAKNTMIINDNAILK